MEIRFLGPCLLRADARATRASSSIPSSPATRRPPPRRPRSTRRTSSSPTVTPTTSGDIVDIAKRTGAHGASRSSRSPTSSARPAWRTCPTRTSAARSSSRAAGCGSCRPGTRRPRPNGHGRTRPPACVINLGGKTVYHLGDTALFSDLRLVAERDPIDVALMCIGGHYTMDRHDAVHGGRAVGAAHGDPVPLRHVPADRDRRRGVQGRRRVADVVEGRDPASRARPSLA